MSSLDIARQLAAEAAEVLAGDPAAGAVWPTLDPRTIPSKVAGGDLAVVVNPPEWEFTTWHERDLEFSVWLIAGPANDIEAAWGRLDAAVTALATPLGVASAAPDVFTDEQNATYPAYVLTVPTSHHI